MEAGALLLAEFGEGKSCFTYLLSRRLSSEALRDPETPGWVPLRLDLKELRGVRDARELLGMAGHMTSASDYAQPGIEECQRALLNG
ncbi:hypothetical protein FRACA_950013 [Frankia canadensis]|uniref:Uncharacterized protein n=1 Tax=Frankia canadensis TaxID=1836972 RepID=A0A2I2L2Q2_9ACTN|nr:hypothetical protein [Frankia canadensis]SNQ52194.1 hypothetical protein FRACA_950013 [Frankia canadensis]SOU59484.1 hypothetical protein FRACA_950013 [Frankia canadensis]